MSATHALSKSDAISIIKHISIHQFGVKIFTKYTINIAIPSNTIQLNVDFFISFNFLSYKNNGE